MLGEVLEDFLEEVLEEVLKEVQEAPTPILLLKEITLTTKNSQLCFPHQVLATYQVSK